MLRNLRLLTVVSRPEFLPANSASLIIGLAWGFDRSMHAGGGLVIPFTLAFAVITLVSAFAAQVNTTFDFELDLIDSRKKELVQAMSRLGRKRLKSAMIAEFLLSLAFILILFLIQEKPLLFVMWMIAVFLAYSYSAPPLRLKSRSWFALLTLLLVLSMLPISFVFHTFASGIEIPFLVFLCGHALTVYGVIIPAEIRDYFGDKMTNTETLTVRLGLVKASLLSIVLLGTGGILCGTAFLARILYGLQHVLLFSLPVMVVVYIYVLAKYSSLYRLSREYALSGGQISIAQDIMELSAYCPRWITLITQSIVLMSLVLLTTKLFL